MMKRLLPFLLLTLAQVSGAQTMSDTAYVALAELRTQKSVLMTEALQLSESQSEKFWPIYREYENEMDKLTESRLQKLKFFADNYQSMNNDKADELAKDVLAMQKERTKLLSKYYKKMRKALDSITAARFVQVDRQINTLLDVEIMQMVPLIAAPEELGLMPAEE